MGAVRISDNCIGLSKAMEISSEPIFHLTRKDYFKIKYEYK